MPRLLALVLLCIAATGCELIADFDRSKIPDPVRDAGSDGDAAAPRDAATDEDAGREDAGTDEDAGDDDAG